MEFECLYIYNLINKTYGLQNFTGGAYRAEIKIIQQIKGVSKGGKYVPINVTFVFSGNFEIHIDKEGRISGGSSSYGYYVIIKWHKTYLESVDYIFEKYFHENGLLICRRIIVAEIPVIFEQNIFLHSQDFIALTAIHLSLLFYLISESTKRYSSAKLKH